MRDTLKISSNAEKVSTPGKKQVWRIQANSEKKNEGDWVSRLSLIHIFAQADFRLTMTDSLIDYDSKDYAALGIQGKGTAIISNSVIHGKLSTYPRCV